MPRHQPQGIQPHERSLDDLPFYIPRYIYKGIQQFREIQHIEYVRYEALNRALIQRYNGQKNTFDFLRQVSYPRYQEYLQRLDCHYEISPPKNPGRNSHRSFPPSIPPANTSKIFFYNPTPYFIFRIDQTVLKEEFLQFESRGTFRFYQDNLFLTMTPLPAHGIAAGELTLVIDNWVFNIGLQSQFKAYLSSGFKALDNDNEERVPDTAFGAKNPPARFPNHRPSLTIEIGETQSLPSLSDDAQWWLDPTKGGALVCITCKLDRTPRLVIDVWERQTTERGQEETKKSQHIIIGKAGKAAITVRGGPLRVGFRLVFGRSPSATEQDLVINDDRLKNMALTIWQQMGLLH